VERLELFAYGTVFVAACRSAMQSRDTTDGVDSGRPTTIPMGILGRFLVKHHVHSFPSLARSSLNQLLEPLRGV
jgi:hypothetical protein